jgi:Tol biopolymer transport system component
VYWLDRASNKTIPINGSGPTWTFRITHDGRRVAFGGNGLWLYDPGRDVSVRIPTKFGAPWPPVWSPDDRAIAITNGPNISVISVGTDSSERVLKGNDDTAWADPMDWAADNSAIYYVREPAASRQQWQLWRYVMASAKIERVPTGPGNVLDARVSPDSKWIAWVSDATGRQEVYLGPVAGTSTPMRISKAGGGSPRWRGDGRELLFMGGDGRVASVTVELKGATPVIGEPKVVSSVVVNPEPFGRDPFLHTRFEVTPTGDRLLVQTPPDVGIYQLTLIQGWERKVARP